MDGLINEAHARASASELDHLLKNLSRRWFVTREAEALTHYRAKLKELVLRYGACALAVLNERGYTILTMQDRLHPLTRQIVSAGDPSEALRLAQALAANTPPNFNRMEWLTVSVREPYGEDSPRWLALVAFAFEQFDEFNSPADSLSARARLIAALGCDEHDPFQSLAIFFDRARVLCGGTTPEVCLASLKPAQRGLLTHTVDSPVWQRSRDTIREIGRLRQVGRALAVLVKANVELPDDLSVWARFGADDTGLA